MTRVTGVERLRAKIKALSPELRKEIRAEMEKGALEMVGMARRLVPVDSGNLRNSIGATWGDVPGGAMVLAQAKTSEGERITIYAGNEQTKVGKRQQFQLARLIEFGTVKMLAQPYFYPSWRALRKRIKSRNTRAINKVMKKVAAGGN